MKNKTKLPCLRTDNLVVNVLPNELLIYDLEAGKAYCLNETASLIMDECNGTNSMDEALVSLNRKLKTKLDEEMVWMVIEQFKKFNIIKGDYEVPVQTTKVTRRKILQSAAMLGITLPIVSALVVPTSIQAQSCAQNQSPCTGPNGGQGNCCNPLVCVNIEGLGGAMCQGCLPVGFICGVGLAPCCGNATCIANMQGIFICEQIVG